MAIIHPWESGRDNLPDWDRPLSYVDISAVGEYERRDTQHVDADQRPHKADYDRYMALVQFCRGRKWDPQAIAAECPFWVADVGMNAILLRAEQDLAALADALGNGIIAKNARRRAARLMAGVEALWSEAAGGYVSLDLRRSEHAADLSAGTFLPLYAGAVPEGRLEPLMTIFKAWSAAVPYTIPSFDPVHALFDPVRYWRGPVWAVVNWMIADGLKRHGEIAVAEQVRASTAALMEGAGFYESYSPVDGQGCGGDDFTWTAAIWLAWASPMGQAAAA